MKNTQIRIETLSYHYESIMVNNEVERAIKSIEVTYRAYKHNHVLNGHFFLILAAEIRVAGMIYVYTLLAHFQKFH